MVETQTQKTIAPAPQVDAPTASPEGSASMRASAVVAATAMLAACSDSGAPPGAGATEGGRVRMINPPGSITDAQAARFLLRAQFSASLPEIEEVKTLGYEAWLDSKLTQTISKTGWNWLKNDQQYYNSTYIRIPPPMDRMMWFELFASQQPVRKRLALALSEIFVVSILSTEIDWRCFLIAAYWDLLVAATDYDPVVADPAAGTFKTLIKKITLSPAMGVYLNTRGNKRAHPETGSQPDENYARELMQLFTIGLVKLNPNGTPILDPVTQQPIPTYDQATVSQLAKVFTGYDYSTAGSQPAELNRVRSPMVCNTQEHEYSAVNLQSAFGITIPANKPPATQLKLALDAICDHPNVAPFFCKQLIQKLVTSNPSPDYVQRVAAVFNASSADHGKGFLRYVIKAVLLDPEALDDATLTDPMFGKVREPFIRFAQWGRTFKVTSDPVVDIPGQILRNWRVGTQSSQSTGLGQSPFRSQTVFNFFTPDYQPDGSNFYAPEMQIANETTTASYLNFIWDVIRNGKGNSNGGIKRPTYKAYTDVLDLPGYGNTAEERNAALVEQLDLLFTAKQLGAATKAQIVTAMNSFNNDPVTSSKKRVHTAIFLIMASPEYLVQK